MIADELYFSIVIPVYNRASTVGPTLLSVLNQSFPHYECIVVDDGSEDGEKLSEVVRYLSDPRFIYVRRDNGGGGAARNSGIEAARGRYIAFLDSDDLFLLEKLKLVHEYLATSGADAVYSRAFVDRGSHGRMWVRPSRPIRANEDMGEYLFVANEFVPTPTIVMRASLAKEILFDPTLMKGQDLDFCLRAHAQGVRFQMIDEPLIIWVDSNEAERSSRRPGISGPLEWLSKSASLLTPKAALGYRATVLAYYQPKWRLFTVIKDLLLAYVKGGVSSKILARQFLRFALPRMAYRRLVDFVVSKRGVCQRTT